MSKRKFVEKQWDNNDELHLHRYIFLKVVIFFQYDERNIPENIHINAAENEYNPMEPETGKKYIFL